MRSSILPHRSPSAFIGCLMVIGLTTSCSLVASVDDGPSEAYKQELADHLSEAGVTMYGAHWCYHCADQKALFGEAVKAIPYVECDPEGENAQPELCQAKALPGYPTWEVNGELYPGVYSLTELAKLSDFPAP
ncbi:MAG: hypothetical protein AAGE59_19450 [Cyanobacteria bacterium P01_F01_bin.86]